MGINESFNLFNKLADSRDEVHFNFIKQVLLLASGLFGITVSLHKSNPSDNYSRIAFALALVLLSLGILLLTIALFAQVAAHKARFLAWKEEVQLQIGNANYQPKIKIVNPPLWYAVCEKIGYVSLVLSILCLTVYAVLVA